MKRIVKVADSVDLPKPLELTLNCEAEKANLIETIDTTVKEEEAKGPLYIFDF
jgi:hypothetical protein